VANKMSEKKKSASQSETEEPQTEVSEKSSKSTKTATRNERQSKPAVRRDGKSTAASGKKSKGFRNWRVVRFVREAYHELRYKVTWPTFQEARNMTLVVIALSTIIGLILGLVDAGLFQLFRLVSGK
jgi:preprotein translocase SecE subunit